jgi:tetratricopeptide (TPR) repeat protein
MGGAKALASPANWAGHDEFPGFGRICFALDCAIEAIVIAMLAFAPWPFGSVDRWSEEIFIAGAAALALCFVLRALADPLKPIVRTWAYLPIGLFLALGLFQLIPFPPSVLRYISPHTVAVKSWLLADVSGGASAPMTVTFYAWATQHDLRLVLSLAVIFFVVVNVFRTPRQVKRLLVSVCVIGAAVVALALAQDMSGSDKIYWAYPANASKAVAGPLLQHAHFCQYLSLTIGAALALLLVMAAPPQSARRDPAARRVCMTLLGLLVVAAAATACLSLSRAGLVGEAIAGAVLLTLNAVRRASRQGWIFAACAAVIAAGVFVYAQSDVSQRVATLIHPVTEYNLRWQILKDICAAWPHFPLFGVGLGAHEVVYPMFDRLNVTDVYQHAYIEFAQMLEETGALGLAAVVGFLAVVATAFFKAASGSGTVRAVALGLGFGLIDILVQSFSDFGQHVPAIALLTAVECALLINVAHWRAGQETPGVPPFPNRLRLPGVIVGAAAVGVGFFVALVQADHARIAQAIWRPSGAIADALSLTFSQLSEDQFRQVIDDAAAAHHADPGNITYLYQWGNFQWSQAEVKHAPNVPEDVRTDAEKMLAANCLGIFSDVRRICPCYGLAIFMAGNLQYLVFDQPIGADLIRLAAQITPSNPQVAAQAAWVDTREGRYSDAIAACRHYLGLQGVIHGNFGVVAFVLVHGAQRPDLAIPLAGDDPDRLMDIVGQLRNMPDRANFQTLASSLELRANSDRKAALLQACQAPDAAPEDLVKLAQIDRSEHDLDHAIEYYRRALISHYDETDWRMELAQTLLDAGRKDQAVSEASLVLRLDPNSQPARQLIFNATGAGTTSSGQ